MGEEFGCSPRDHFRRRWAGFWPSHDGSLSKNLDDFDPSYRRLTPWNTGVCSEPRGTVVEPAIMPRDRAGYERDRKRFGATRRTEYDLLKEAANSAIALYR